MFKKFVVLGAGLLAAGAACAQGSWYGDLSVGRSSVNMTNDNVITGATAYSFSNEEKSTAFKLHAGYQFNKNFAIEGGYVNLGKFTFTENVTAPAVGSAKASIKADGWDLVAVGIAPLSQDFSLFGKLGTIYSTVNTDITTSGAVTLTGAANRKRSELNLTYGLGAQYAFNKTVSVRGEWNRFDKLGDRNTTGEADVNVFSLGLNFKF